LIWVGLDIDGGVAGIELVNVDDQVADLVGDLGGVAREQDRPGVAVELVDLRHQACDVALGLLGVGPDRDLDLGPVELVGRLADGLRGPSGPPSHP
jgi:hypothetical protein